MRKIINGKAYDTDKAKKIAYASNGVAGSFDYCEETLYRKKTGEFFIYGEGGPRSAYARVDIDGSICWGKKIVLLSDEEAKEWVEQNANEKYEKIFGKVQESASALELIQERLALVEHTYKEFKEEFDKEQDEEQTQILREFMREYYGKKEGLQFALDILQKAINA